MILHVFTEGERHKVEVPDDTLREAQDFFAKMDRDMDAGWRMGPEWIERLDQTQRCQVAADKLLAALGSENATLAMLMAGYILARLPGVRAVNIDADGEMLNTEFRFADTAAGPAPARAPAPPQVSELFRVGKAWRFATLDPRSGRWIESPIYASEEDARAARAAALEGRPQSALN